MKHRTLGLRAKIDKLEDPDSSKEKIYEQKMQDPYNTIKTNPCI